MGVWVQALPAFLVVAGILLVPGGATAYALGLRGIPAWGAAPSLGTTVLALSAALAPVMNLPWTPGLFVLMSLGAVGLAGLLGWGLRWAYAVRVAGDPVRTRLLAVGGATAGGVFILFAAVRGMGSPHELVDSIDAVFHLSRVREFLDTGVTSSLSPPAYPSAFHELTVTAMKALPGLPIVTAANLSALAVATVVWPIGCVALARQVLGPSALVLLGSGLASAAFTTFPFVLMGWGVLWPNLLGTALLPGVLALSLVALRAVPDAANVSRPLAAAAAVLALPGLTLAHPNALVSLVLFVLVVALTRAATRLRTHPADRRRAGPRVAVLVASLVGLLLVLPRLSPTLASLSSYRWPIDDPWMAVRDIVLLKLQHTSPLWGLVTVMLVGAVDVVRRHRSRTWVVVLFGVSALLFVLAASAHNPWTTALTGYWYNDKVRIAGFATVPALLLAVSGLTCLAESATGLLHPRPAGGPPPHLPQAAVGGVLSAFLVVTLGLDHGAATQMTARYYRPEEADHRLVSPEDVADLGRIAERVPRNVVVVGVPTNGSSLLYALYDRKVLYPVMAVPDRPDETLIGEHLRDAATRTDVCDALRRKNVQYAVTAAVRYWGGFPAHADGLVGLGGTAGFEMVTRSGWYTLYRITACGFDPHPLPLGASASAGAPSLGP